MSIFSGTTQNTSTTGTSTSEMPSWYTDLLYNNLNWANAIAQKPYDPYTGDRVANVSDEEKQAWGNASTNQGMWKPDYNKGTGTLGEIAGNAAPSVQNIDAYMNPYNEAVTQQIAKMGARNLTENLLPGVSDAFIKSGTFGGTRMGEFGNRALRDTGESILAQQGKVLQEGYGNALTAAGADVDRRASAGRNLVDAARAGQGMAAADVSTLNAAGEAKRQAEQRDIDSDMTAHQEAIDYPMNTVDWFMNQLQGTAKGAPTTTTTRGTTTGNTGPSTLSQLATGLFGAAGTWKSIFGNGN